MAVPIASSLATILPLVQTLLSEVTELPAPERVMITARREDAVPHFQADSDILIRPMDEHQIRSVNDGQGRRENRWEARFRVTVRSRLYTDEVNQDAQFLIDQALGHIMLRDAITDALEFAIDTIVDGQDNCFLYQPLRVLRWSEPERERQDAMWGDSSCDVECCYFRIFTPNAYWALNAEW